MRAYVLVLVIALLWATPAGAAKNLDPNIVRAQDAADSFAELVSDFARLKEKEEKLTRSSSVEELAAVQGQLWEIRGKVGSLQASSRNIRTFWLWIQKNSVKTAFGQWAAQIGLGAIPGLVLGSPGAAVCGGFIGALTGLCGTVAVGVNTTDRTFKKWDDARSEALTQKAFVERLKTHGIELGSKNLEKLLVQFSEDLTAVAIFQNPKQMQIELDHFRMTLNKAILLLTDEPAKVAVLEGIRGEIPGKLSLRHLLSSQAWSEKAFLKLLQLRNTFREAARTMGLPSKGFALEQELRFVATLQPRDPTFNLKSIFLTNDPLANRIVELAGGHLLIPRIMESLDTVMDSGRKIELQVLVDSARSLDPEPGRPVGLSVLQWTLRIPKEDGSWEEHKFESSVATRAKTTMAVLEEKNWIEPFLESLGAATQASPCETILEKTRIATTSIAPDQSLQEEQELLEQQEAEQILKEMD